jgi:hypothetical protein
MAKARNTLVAVALAAATGVAAAQNPEPRDIGGYDAAATGVAAAQNPDPRDIGGYDTDPQTVEAALSTGYPYHADVDAFKIPVVAPPSAVGLIAHAEEVHITPRHGSDGTDLVAVEFRRHDGHPMERTPVDVLRITFDNVAPYAGPDNPYTGGPCLAIPRGPFVMVEGDTARIGSLYPDSPKPFAGIDASVWEQAQEAGCVYLVR